MASDLKVCKRALEAMRFDSSLRLNIVAGFFGMFWIAVPLGAPLPLLMQNLGATATQLGILSASWQIATVAQIPAAFFMQRLAKRKTAWVIVCLSHRFLWAAPALVPAIFPDQKTEWTSLIIAALAVSNLLANLGTASWLSWMADLVPAPIAGRFWATRQAALSVALILATLSFGCILSATAPGDSIAGFQWVFLLCAGFGITDVVIHSFVREPEQPSREQFDSVFACLRAPFLRIGFGRLAFVMGIWTCAQSFVGYTLAMPGFFSMVHLQKQFGASFAEASWIFCCCAFGAFAMTPRIGRWIDSAGAPAVFVRLVALTPLSILGWWVAPVGTFTIRNAELPLAVAFLTPIAILQGSMLSGALLCQFKMTQMATSPNGRTLAMAIHWSLCGLGGCAGAMLAGVLQDQIPKEWFESLRGSWTAFDLLVLLNALISWFAVLPFALRLESEFSSSSQAEPSQVRDRLRDDLSFTPNKTP
jgi:hypothetical protein